MRIFWPIKQTTLLLPGTGPDHDPDRGHLHIVVTSPNAANEVLLVPVCSAYPKCDATCILEAGHSFIKHKSFAMYARAKLSDAKHIVKQVSNAEVTYKGLLDKDVFDKVCDGVLDSPHTPPHLKKFFNENGDD